MAIPARVAADWACGTVAVVVLCAGVLKAIDVPVFESALRTWAFVPEPAVFPLALTIPVLEVALGLMWLLRIARRASEAVLFTALLAFTGVYVAHLIAGERPDCGCFALVDRYFEGVSRAAWAIVRNGVLLGLLFGAGVLRWRSRGDGRVISGSPDVAVPAPAARGFTIVETILVIAIAGVLLSLLLPSLSRVRDRARELRSLANLRSHAAVFGAYASDEDDHMPYFVDPRATYSVVRCDGLGRSFRTRYFGAHAMWSYALADRYYDGNAHHDSFYPPGYPQGLEGAADVRTGSSRYWYPCAFIAAPEYWNPRTRTGPEQWAATRHSAALFPADKALLIAWYPLELDLPDPVPPPSTLGYLAMPLALMDGSARSVALDQLTTGYSNGDGMFGKAFVHLIDFPFGMHTIDGVRGRDVLD